MCHAATLKRHDRVGLDRGISCPDFISVDAMSAIVGMKFRAVINGKGSINGTPYSATIEGDVIEIDGDATLYDAVRLLTYHIERDNEEMEYPMSIELAIADKFEDE
jgi:hypothetical protein